ncbi:MAG: secretin N-terminal domain-containing protein [Rhodocyclaceae bacterium]|nr:secretin N-terminal domain-containing protein [Rhodocyclaceae bacterium]MDZ4215082.1 secretin N-terminal domain-containing protein [Rhodocyclaceae bacterium]
MKFTADHGLMAKALGLGLALSLTACSSAFPPRDTAAINAINAQMKQAAMPKEKPAPVPEAVTTSLLPPLRNDLPRTSKKQLEQRFDLVVTDAPITQVLMGLVHGTKYSIMVKPKNDIARPVGAAVAPGADQGERITVNLKNVTVFEALDSIREVYGYDYTQEGNRIYVSQPELQTRLYQVNYIIGQRRGVSDIQVIGGATIGSSSSSSSGSGSTSGGASGSSGTGSFSSVQASGLSTIAKSDLWGEVEDVLRTTLGCQIPGNQAEPAAAGSGGAATSTSSTSSNSVGRAELTFRGDTPKGARQRGVDGCSDGRAMSVSQMSGTVLVRGMPHEHRTIEKMLKTLQLNIERQVIIEAKIIDVELNAGSQQGINWSNFSHGLHRASVGITPTSVTMNQPSTSAFTGGIIAPATTLGGALGTTLLGAASGNAFSAGLGIAMQFRNFSALVNFLETQGEVHVLSSPRIATLNSQKAVIKVGTEEPFVSSIVPGTSVVAAGAASSVATPPSLNYQPFFSGIALDVTPRVDDKGDITLHVHAMVNSIQEKEKIASPDAGSVRVPFAVNTINETDTVVKAKDGQVIVIGGLMTERVSDNRGKTPGLGDVPGVGSLFSKGGQQKSKRELVILLKPTVVADDAVWNQDIVASQGRIEAIGAAGAPPVQPAPAQ